MTAVEFARLIRDAKPRGDTGWWDGRCPAHDDQRASLSFRDGDRGLVAECHAACTFEKIAAAVGRRPSDFFHRVNGHPQPRRQIVAVYDFVDERGALLFQEVKFGAPKDFRLRRPDGKGGFTWDLKGVRRVVYRLDELAEQRRVFLVEGPKDANNLWALDIPATTTAGGANGWRAEYAQQIKDAGAEEVIACRDNDEAGLGYVRRAAADLVRLDLRVRMLNVPGLADHGDVSDYITAERAAGRTDDEIRAALLALAEQAPAFDPNEDAAGAPMSAPPAPQIALTAEDGVLTWPDGATISFARVVEGSRGVSAEVSVTWQEKELDYGALNLLATRSRDGLVKKLERAVPDVPWSEYLDLACRRMVARLREGEPIEELQARPRTGDTALITPIVIEHETTVHYAAGGAGKSLTALLCAVAARTGCTLPGGLRAVHPVPAVMILNWETNKSPQEARLYGLCRGLGITPPSGIYHRHMSGPLIDDTRRLRADVARLHVGLVIVDSLAPASGPDPETAGAVVPVMNVLGSLPGVTRLVLAHVSHANEAARDPRPYGSVFVWNLARSCWYLQRSTEDRDDLVIGLYHKKANDERLHDALSLRFTFAEGTITPATADLAAVPELRERTPLAQQLAAALANGTKTIPALAIELDAKEDTIDKTLRRHHGRFVQLPGDKPPFLWGLAR